MRKEMVYKGAPAVVRWIARIIALGFIVLFLFSFFTQGGPNEMMALSGREKLRLACLPLLFTVGFALSFRREATGGLIMVISVLAFNLLDVVTANAPAHTFKFTFLLIPGLVLFLLPRFSPRQSVENAFGKRQKK